MIGRGGGTRPPTRRFIYGTNGVSERTSLDVSNAATFYRPQQGAIDVYSPNALNQYATVNAQTYIYDGNGNLTDDGVNVYGYDSESRLTSFVSASVAASYRYDALDRRIEKTVDGAITVFLHAGEEEIAEYDSSGNLLRRYVPGAGFGEIIATVEATPSGEVRYSHHEDGLGSTVARSNDAGWITEINTYGPFGEGTAPHGSNAFGFTGQRFDAESGLYYFRARYYSPALGRFLQPDPAGFIDGLNLYTYVANSPLNFIDPLGLDMRLSSNGSNLLQPAGNPSPIKRRDDPTATYDQFIGGGGPFRGGGPTRSGSLKNRSGDLDTAASTARTHNPTAGSQRQAAAQEIAGGHAFGKHASEFGFKTRPEMAAHVERVMANPDATKNLLRGRTAYWDEATQSVVIRDPSSPDGGTVLKPRLGRAYFDNLR